MPVKFWPTIVRFWFFLSYLITTVISKNYFHKNGANLIVMHTFAKSSCICTLFSNKTVHTFRLLVCKIMLGHMIPTDRSYVPTGLQMCVQLVVVSLSAVFARAIYTAPFVSFDQDFAVAPLHPAGREFWIDFFGTATADACRRRRHRRHHRRRRRCYYLHILNASTSATVGTVRSSVRLQEHHHPFQHDVNFLVLTPMIQDFLSAISDDNLLQWILKFLSLTSQYYFSIF